MNLLFLLLFRTAIVLLTAWFISDAIVAYKEQRYFAFGVNIMLILWEISEFVCTYF